METNLALNINASLTDEERLAKGPSEILLEELSAKIIDGSVKFDKRRKPNRKGAVFEPITWQPVYDMMANDRILGMKKKDIAEKYGYTPIQVCNILNSKQGRLLIRAAQERIREKMLRTIPQRLEDISDKFVKRIDELVSNDDIFEKSPFAVIDRGMKFLQGTRHLVADIQTPSISQSQVSNKAIESLAFAINKLQEAESLKQLPITPVEVVTTETGK